MKKEEEINGEKAKRRERERNKTQPTL